MQLFRRRRELLLNPRQRCLEDVVRHKCRKIAAPGIYLKDMNGHHHESSSDKVTFSTVCTQPLDSLLNLINCSLVSQ